MESFIGKIFVIFSSTVGNGLADNVNWGFLLLLVFTVVLLELSCLITDCCFFLGFIIACSTLTFLLLTKFDVDTGENGRFCGGE
jgi:hypothetical protein